MNIGSPPSGNSATSYVVDTGTSEEVTFRTATALGETETAGLVMNIIPRSGGNTIRGSVFASATGAALQSDNLTPALRAQGVTAATPLTGVYDVTATLGGPIAKDRLWYFVNAHAGASTRASANVFYNLNAAQSSQWLYAPDLNRPEYSDRTFENASGRVTWQVTPRHKINGFWDTQQLCRACTGATPGLAEPQRVSPEAVGVLGRPLHVAQAAWSSPLTNRLLVDAGFGATFFGVGNFERDPNPTRGLIRVAEQCASGCAANGNIPGLVYRSQDFSVAHTGSYLWRAALTYVTGAHSLKVGYQHTFMTDDRTWMTNDQNLTYRFNNGVPNQLTQSISPWVNNARVAWQGLYVQDQWTRDRLTLQGAARFDRAWSWFPRQQEGPSRFLPTPIVIAETRGVDSYKDVTLRMGAAYDVSGTGKTALKMTLGKYLDGAGVSGTYANTNPSLRMPQTTPAFGTVGVTRAWTDANQNFVPDCDLMNGAAQDLRAAGGDLCGIVSNTSFGRNVLTNNFDPGLLEGWGVRPSDWHLGVSIEQQIGSRSSVAVTYTRRWYDGFSLVDNRALQASDLTPFSIVAPVDPRLPDGGGYVVSGLYDVVPEKAGVVDNLVADSTAYGNWSQYFNGVDVTVRVRSVKGFTVAAGTSTGQTVADNCAVRARLPELATTTTGTSAFGPGLGASAVTPVSPYCHVAFGVLTQLRGFSSYHVPKIDMQLSAAFQSKPGPMLAANYAVPNAAVVPSLGRNLSGNAANVTVNLVAPGTMYGDRINQVDFRAAKTLRYRRLRMLLAIDALQRAELERGAVAQPGVRTGRHVAAAADDHDAAAHQDHERGRLLSAHARAAFATRHGAVASAPPVRVRWARGGVGAATEAGARRVLDAARCADRCDWRARTATNPRGRPWPTGLLLGIHRPVRGFRTRRTGQAFSDFLLLKYKDVHFDAVIAVRGRRARTCHRSPKPVVSWRADCLFRVGPSDAAASKTRPASSPALTFTDTLALIADLQPQVRQIFVVSGASPSDMEYERLARQQFRPFESRFAITYLDGLPSAELESRLSSLPANSAIYYLLVNRDGSGENVHPLDYLSHLTAIANAPVYCWVDSAMGQGIVGGSLKDQSAQLDALGRLALRVLSGESAASIPVSSPNLNVRQVDWRQLRRWGISESRVPQGTRVLFKEPSRLGPLPGLHPRHASRGDGPNRSSSPGCCCSDGCDGRQRHRCVAMKRSCAAATSASAISGRGCSRPRTPNVRASPANCTTISASRSPCSR